MDKLTEEQKQELKRRENIEIEYGYECKTCGFCFLWDGYNVDGVDYPIITGFYNVYDSQNWTEDHMCPNCKIPYRFDDGT